MKNAPARSSNRRMARALLWILLPLFAPTLAHATVRTLSFLPAEKITAMPPLLQHGEVALIESSPDGKMRQVTVLALVAAPPEVVHDVLVTPEKYPDFIRNMTKSKVRRNADGSIDDEYWIDLTLTHFEGVNHFRPNPDGSVDVKATDPNDDAIFRWEFYRVPGGTVMVQYGYTDVLHSNDYIKKMTREVPSMEHGLALSAQLAYVRSIKARAEKLARPGSFPPVDASAKAPGFDFLLRRGRVVVVRSLASGRLADVSILDRVAAPRAKVEELLAHPGSLDGFVDGTHQRELRRTPEGLEWTQKMDISIFSWSSRFLSRDDAQGHVDVIGVEGDLRGAQYRWDVSPVGDSTQVVFRARQDIAAASPLLLGMLFRKEPLFEHGLTVATGLVQVAGLRRRAEAQVAHTSAAH